MSKRIIHGVQILLTAALACCSKSGSRPVHIVHLEATTHGDAVGLWFFEKSALHVGQLRADGTVGWSHEVACSRAGFGVESGLAIAHDVAIVNCIGGVGAAEHAETTAFNVSNGTRLWSRTEPLPVTTESSGLGIRVVGDAVVLGFRDHVTVLDVENGSTRFTYPVDPLVPGILADDSRLIFSTERGVVVIDAKHGSETSGFGQDGCVAAGAYFEVKNGELLRRSLDHLDAAPTAFAFVLGSGPATSLAACGTYKDDLIFEVTVGSVRETHVIRTTADAHVVSDVALGPGKPLTSDLAFRRPDLCGPNGVLPRYLMIQYEEPEDFRIIAVDLEAGAIAWRGHADATLVHSDLFRVGSTWVAQRDDGSSLTTFDGNTGTLRGAIQLAARDGVQPVSPSAVTADSIWVLGDGWSPLNRPTLARLHLNLEPAYVAGIKVKPDSAAVH